MEAQIREARNAREVSWRSFLLYGAFVVFTALGGWGANYVHNRIIERDLRKINIHIENNPGDLQKYDSNGNGRIDRGEEYQNFKIDRKKLYDNRR